MDEAQPFFHSPVSSILGSGLPAQARVPIGHPASSNTAGHKTQLAISLALGLTSFLTFCFLRTRWIVLFAPRSKLRRHTPPVLPTSFFGWIPRLLSISEDELLTCVGLDALMVLRFFTMSMKLFAYCMIPGLMIILPVNYYFTYYGDEPKDPDEGDDEPFLSIRVAPQASLLYLFTQFTFTWVFSLLSTWMIWHTYEGYIDVRRRYLVKRRKAIVNRTIMIVGLPPHLQSDRALAAFYESLGAGPVESAYVCRHVRSLKRVIEQRAQALRDLEVAYTEYYGNPSGRPDYDPEAIVAGIDNYPTGDSRAPTLVIQSPEEQPLLASARSQIKKPPTIRLGFLGLFGEKKIKIDHCREIFTELDERVQDMRTSRAFVTTGTGFVTFEAMSSAQFLAQTVNTQQTLACKTFLAPEPTDVFWDNLNLPPGESDIRSIIINVIAFALIFFVAGPVGLLSSFLNLDSLSKLFPGIRKQAEKNALFQSLIQGFLPTVGVIIFVATVPQILDSLSRRQGVRSRSDAARMVYSKYFTFILINVFLIFTVAGTWSQMVNDVYHNLGELSLLFASSLPRVAPFFVNYTMLRGLGMFPLQLLQISQVFIHTFQSFISKTPRDYAEARSPPELSYGVVYANATLGFVIILIYSCFKPVILIFGVIYFALGYMTYKYQLLYVYFHPYESGGRIWPMVYNRLILSLLIFQVTMIGVFTLRHTYYLALALAPLPVGTLRFWYWTTNTYKRTAKYVPLEILRPSHAAEIDCTMEHHSHDHSFATSFLPVPGTMLSSQKPSHVAVNMRADPDSSATNGRSINGTGIESTATVTTASGRSKRKRAKKRAAHEDDYQALPDRYTDYKQPPTTLYPGVLNSHMRHYCHPAIAGALPTLWLPLRKGRVAMADSDTSDDEDGHSRSHLQSKSSDVPMTYDEGDNLAGGGQDEEDDDDEWEHVFYSAEEYGADSAPSSAIGSSRSHDLPTDTDSTIRRSRRISDVYYHHPERRTPNASSASAHESTTGHCCGPSASQS